MKKAVWIILLVIGGISIIWFYYNKPHRQPSAEQAIPTTATRLFADFSKNESTANSKYLNKVLEVSGVVTNVTINTDQKSVVMLETSDVIFGINCTMDKNDSSIVVGDSILLVGICTGFLSDVVMIQCQLKKLRNNE